MGDLLARPSRTRVLAAAALLAGLLACAADPEPERGGETGVYHTVERGETVWRIARSYGVRADDVVRANDVEDVTRIAVGSRLWIPGARSAGVEGSSGGARLREAAVRARMRRKARNDALREAELAFAWPLRGRVSSSFGWRHGRRHQGVDLAARSGTGVQVAEAGKVVYSGRLGAYGRIVVVKHSGHYSTVYAHNRRNLVAKGAFVEKGDRIAEVGVSGNATGPHLHFEIRYAERPRDPLLYLP